jgi:Calx-beta domain/Bacterial virulence factor lipase N-terminal
MKTRHRTWRLNGELLEDRATPSTVAAFGLGALDSGPFPSDRFTVADGSQLTGRRVNLPLPDAATRPSDYADLTVINTLDGFNLQPRLSIPFSGPIDVTTVSSGTVFLMKLGDTTSPDEAGGEIVGINQTVWDVATNTLHVESDALLDQHARYALFVTRGVRDANGLPVEPSAAFERFRHDLNSGQAANPDLAEYREDVLDALGTAEGAGVRPKDVVTASVFTTQSATAILEKIRDQIHAATPEPAHFLLGPGGERTVFELDDITGITWQQQTGVNPAVFNPVNLDLSLIRDFAPGAVGSLAFGSYLSPDFEVHPGQYIPPVATRTGTPAVQRTNEVYFNLFLPSGPMPEGGWPVAIFGHGAGRNKNAEPLPVAATMAAHGIATVIINVPGNGFGPLGTLTVNRTTADPVTFSAGGRGIDQDGDHVIGAREGQFATAPQTIVSNRDAQRQTVADLMQLVRVVEAGTDVDGDGGRDLDPSRIYYFGQSLGGIIGTMFLAVEPDVRAGVPNVPGGAAIEWNRLGPANRPTMVGQSLSSRVPSLINGPGVTHIDGVQVSPGPAFNENMPLRDGTPLTVRLADGTTHIIQSRVINTVAGAMAIQEVFENTEWVSQSGNPVAYAPHLRKAPLAGVPAKSVIIQFAKGDQIVPNPTATALLRAGDLADRTTFFRNDLAFAENPAAPKNPHGFLTAISGVVPLAAEIALGAQRQIATFFASDGTVIFHPEPVRFFETPIVGPLPEHLNFIGTDPPIITIADASVSEGDGGIRTLTFTVSLTRESALPVSVHYGTADGTAKAGEDYEATSGMLVFAPGETTNTITIVIKGDREEEGKETFFVNLWQAENALLVDDLGVGTVFDDD